MESMPGKCHFGIAETDVSAIIITNAVPVLCRENMVDNTMSLPVLRTLNHTYHISS